MVIIVVYSVFKMFDNYGLYFEDVYGFMWTEFVKIIVYFSFIWVGVVLVVGWIVDWFVGMLFVI